MATLAEDAVSTMAQAAAEIERLRAVNAGLVETLQLISDAADQINAEIDKQTHDEICRDDWIIPLEAEFNITLNYCDMDRLDRSICAAQRTLRAAIARATGAP